MFKSMQEMRERREDGFTLIELLVVVLIIAILAAIAIPFFLRQRERSWESQSQSSLKNAATAMESWSTEHNGSYADADTLTDIKTQGFRETTPAVTLTIDSNQNDYTITAEHASLNCDWIYTSSSGVPTRESSCTE